MKFKNIKVGDTVFVEQRVVFGWNSNKIFWIPKKVDRTTKTQFIIEDGKRFKKDNGLEVGSGLWSYAKKLGDNNNFSKDEIYDQSEEMKLFSRKIKTEFEVVKIIDSLEKPSNSELTHEEIKSAYSYLLKAKKTLNKSTL